MIQLDGMCLFHSPFVFVINRSDMFSLGCCIGRQLSSSVPVTVVVSENIGFKDSQE